MRRYFKAALQTLLSEDQRLKLKERTRYVKVSQKDIDKLSEEELNR